ncbi:hypothetical protein JKG47_15980 [Acidithiobacillus sp. MC6.1]|nr:hypothetical protein [Acidithiobacillus sp. MC6.1]
MPGVGANPEYVDGTPAVAGQVGIAPATDNPINTTTITNGKVTVEVRLAGIAPGSGQTAAIDADNAINQAYPGACGTANTVITAPANCAVAIGASSTVTSSAAAFQ